MYSIINHTKIYTNKENIQIKENKVFQPEITIVKVDCMKYITQILKDELIEMGWICSIISQDKINNYIEKNKTNNKHFFLFLYPLQITKHVVLYKRYILYQLEQNVNNAPSINYKQLHESNNLKNIYDNATLILDYCQLNVNVMKQYYNNDFKIMNIPARNMHIESKKEYKYDIIFMGSMNKRREIILNKLKEKYKVLIVQNIYGEELRKLCNQCNICLNIHYYENAILERVRLNEMMEYGIKIISEKPCIKDMDISSYYDSIHFIEMINSDNLDNLDELITSIEYVKTIEIKHDLKKLENMFKKDIKIFEDICILPKSIAVVTANYGNYDTIKEINIYNKDFFDWYLFTDSNIDNKDYNVIHYPLQFDYAHNNDFNRLYSKYIKCQSLNIDILKKYKYIIWIDSSVDIKNNNLINDIIKLLENKKDLYFYEHFYRNNINDEYAISKTLTKYNNNKLDEQIQKYNETFTNNILYECGFFICKNNEDNIKLLNDWWEENIHYSYQDQISLPYVLWKNNKTPFLLNDNNFIKKNMKGSIWNNKLFGIIRNHNSELH